MKRARKSGSTASNEQQQPDPEITRPWAPELTRCDHCGVLDDRTQATMLFANHPGDGWHWLHPECVREFSSGVSEPVLSDRGRFMGAVLRHDDGSWSAYRYHSRVEGTLLGTAASRAQVLALFEMTKAYPRRSPGWLSRRLGRNR